MRSRSDAVIPEPLAEFDTDEWSKKDFTERVRIGTNLYVLKGLGYPLAAYLFHAVKLSLFVLGWVFFCRFTPGLGTLRDFRPVRDGDPLASLLNGSGPDEVTQRLARVPEVGVHALLTPGTTCFVSSQMQRFHRPRSVAATTPHIPGVPNPRPTDAGAGGASGWRTKRADPS